MGSGKNETVEPLSWPGSDLSLYPPYYELKSEESETPWEELEATCDTLNNTPDDGLEAAIPEVRKEGGIAGVDGILLGVGLSRDQLADGERGFSFDGYTRWR